MVKLTLLLPTALILISLLIRPTLAQNINQAEQIQEYGTTLQVWQAFQELGANLSGPAKSITFRIKTDISYTQQFDFTATNTKIYDKDNNNSSISGCLQPGEDTSSPYRGLALNTGNAPVGYMNVSVNFSCRNYTFIPGHRYLLQISNANRGTDIHFATATTLTSPTDYFTGGGVRYTYDNPFEPTCNVAAYVWHSQTNNNGCIVFTNPQDDLYFVLGDPPANIPNPTPSIFPTPTPQPTKTPLIFIPGIAGSELKVTEDTTWAQDDGHGGIYRNQYKKDEKAWVNELEAIRPGNDDYFDILRLNADGKTGSNIIPNGEIVGRAYQKTIDYFTNQGYVLGQDLFVFGYDWRKDLNVSIPDLEAKINQIEKQTNTNKINIVTHSMGGLLAKKYIENLSNAQKVNKLITIAPPFLGSVKMTKSIIYGDCINALPVNTSPLCLGLSNNEVKDLLQNFPSTFQLMPSQKYFKFYNGSNNLYPTPFKDDRDIDKNNILGELNYDQLKQLLNNLGYNTSLYSSAENFHNIDSFLSQTNGVDNIIIAGSGKPTLGQIIEKNKFNFGGIKIPTKDSIMVNGDSTVPLFSASLNDSTRTLSLFNPNNVYYIEDTHGGIATNNKVLEFVKNILSNNTDIPFGISHEPTKLKGKLYSVHSPVNIDAFDSMGNHTGITTDGDFETNIPGSSYETIEDAKFIFLPDEGIYQLKFAATDEGSFDFKVRTFDNDKNTETNTYKDIPLTKETKGEVFIDNNSTTPPILNIDENGDGANDITYNLPTETATGDTAADQTSPITTIKLDGTKGLNNWFTSDVMVTLNATDNENGSGVSQILYSLDDGKTINIYHDPITLTEEGIKELRVKTIDNAGNEEPIHELEVKIDKTAPEAKIIFNLTSKDFDFIGIDNLTDTNKTDTGDTILLNDEAGNKITLNLTTKERPRREKIILKSIAYNDEKPINLGDNLILATYKVDKIKQITDIAQRIVIKGEEYISSNYDSKTNTTKINLKKPKTKKTTDDKIGKSLLYLTSNKGSLEANY